MGEAVPDFGQEFVRQNKNACAQKVIVSNPEDIKDGGLSDRVHWMHHNKRSTVSLEFQMWDELEQGLYWRSYGTLKNVLERADRKEFSEQDLKTIAEIQVVQATNCSTMGSSVPLYDYVWTRLCEQDGPLRLFITDVHKSKALNKGFWHLLGATASRETEHNAGKQLTELVGVNDFYRLFDHVNGVRTAQELPNNLSFGFFEHVERYLIWYLVQELEIYRQLQKDDAVEVCGKLVAPMVRELLTENHGSRQIERSRGLARYFIVGEIVRTKPLQVVIGDIFQKELEEGLRGDEDNFSATLMEQCENALKDKDARIAAAWKGVKKDVKLERVGSGLKHFVPKEAYESYVSVLRKQIDAMKRFDFGLYEKWIGLRVGIDVDISARGRIRNKMLDVYKKQSQRPSRDVVVALSCSSRKQYPLLDGFLLADMIRSRQWMDANELLMHYRDNASPKPKRLFLEGVNEYVRQHKPIQISDDGLSASACYPQFNLIPDFVNYNQKCFIKKS